MYVSLLQEGIPFFDRMALECEVFRIGQVLAVCLVRQVTAELDLLCSTGKDRIQAALASMIRSVRKTCANEPFRMVAIAHPNIASPFFLFYYDPKG